MMEFFEAVANPMVPFIRYALIAGILSSVAFGMVGSFVVVRRISYIAGAISHAALAGLGASLYFSTLYSISWLTPLAGAMIAAVLSAWFIGWVSLYASEREDTVIGTIWAIGMAIGLIFIAKTPGYTDPMSYLFGNILLIGKKDLYLIMALNILVVAVIILFYPQLKALSFDEPYARTRKVPTGFFTMLLLTIIALTVVLMVSTVGIVMVIAMLTIPAATGSLLVKRLSWMMVLAGVFCALSNTLGLGISYSLDLPTGATTILVSGVIYITVLWGKKLIRKKRIPSRG